MEQVRVRVGFVPSYRWRYTPWCERMRSESLAALAQTPGVQLVALQPSPDGQAADGERGLTPYGAVTGLEQAEAAAAFFARQGVDALVLCPLDFGDERSAAKVAEKVGAPVLLYATKEPPALEDASLARVSDSYCGNLSLASALYRRRLPFHFAGIYFPDEPELARELEAFVRAAAVVKGLRGAQIGQVGVRPATFETVGYDEHALVRQFGQNVIHCEISDVVGAAEGYAEDDPRLEALRVEIRQSAAAVTVAEDYVRQAARLELALGEFWRSNRLSALAVQCWPSVQKLMRLQLCGLFGRLTGKGMLTACETDVLGALAMLVNHRAALGETVPHFVDWTIQHRQDPNLLLAWHCGNAPTCLAADPARTALRARHDMQGALPAREGDAQAGLYQFQLRPGKVTFCRLAEYDGQWKMLIAPGEIEPSAETLAGTWSWVRVRDHARLYRTLVEEGFIHHASMIHGDQTQPLLLACKFLGIRPVLVD